jgi:hypothetical protein
VGQMNETIDNDMTLQEQTNVGNKAQSAYNMYLKSYLDQAYSDLFSDFMSANILELREILNVRIALDILSDKIHADIENGKYAAQQLKTNGGTDNG